MIGKILKGRYCILEQIGKGGEGHLYLARDLKLGTFWAVKEIPLEQKKEAKLMRLLEHSSLPKMVDYVEKGEYCYLVMEYIRGQSLGQWLRAGRCFSAEEILDFGVTICRVLHYLHSRKPAVYYGDLKPDNLMLAPDGRLYLVDMGSSVPGYACSRGEVRGTRGYAAPEQYAGGLCEASDIYALGKTLAVLCGKKRKRYFLQYPRLWLLILRCCQREAGRRPAKITIVETELERIRKGRGRGRSAQAVYLLIPVLAVFICGAIFVAEARPEFTEAFFTASTLFYKADFGEDAEKELQSLLRKYPEEENQRRLLLSLAILGEKNGEMERAALYYEQLLLYEPEYGEAYGAYGLFLCRQGQQEQSERLLESYREQELPAGRCVRIWEKEMEAWQNEKRDMEKASGTTSQ